MLPTVTKSQLTRQLTKPVRYTNPGALVVVMTALLTASCGWVDSTGGSNSVDQTTGLFSQAATTGNPSAGQTNVNLADTRIVQIFEQSTIRVTPTLNETSTTAYEWRLMSSGMENAVCQRVGVFDNNFAVDTLQQACTNQNNCGLSFMQATNTRGGSVFDVAVPQLQAPVSLGYTLFATQPDGSTTTEDFTICAVSVNDSPEAGDDLFRAIRGETLSVSANDFFNLLTNDNDDEDVTNRPLSILDNPLLPPNNASNFQLSADGGFTYTAPFSTAVNTTDRFIYQVTDGTTTSSASATIRIIASNRAPVLTADIPNLAIVAGQALNPDNNALDLSVFFNDPDNDTLVFAASRRSLPTSDNLSITSEGRIVGRVTAADVGTYSVQLSATDGNAETNTNFTLTVLAESTSNGNNAPVVQPVDSLVIAAGDRVTLQVSATDADGDRLQYALTDDSPDFLSINSNNGRITIRAEEPGLFRATLVVSDGLADTTLIFFVRVASEDNQPPQVDDISNITVRGEPINYDVSVFFEDPDGDTMTFTAENLPAGLSISSAGVISGVPTAENVGRHFIEVTADDGNLGMATDGFVIRIIR